ncbi:MAG: ABC transporter ATP-binding protein [Lutisporaceae bacterium]
MNIMIDKITKSYRKKTVLSIGELEVKSNTITGIIGPNGSGKSTLMRIISGIEKQDSGTITFDGMQPTETVRKEMTMVFQKPYLINTSVYNNIAYPLKLRGNKKDEISKKVDSVIELLDLCAIKQQNARTLSGGEAQKVALARAIVFEPRLLLLDEPTSNIDPNSIFTMEKAIRHINEATGATVLLVTHNVKQLRRLCSNAVFLENGSVQVQGTVEILFSNLGNTSIGRFISEEMFI